MIAWFINEIQKKVEINNQIEPITAMYYIIEVAEM